jgi:hypothetical protein
MPATEKTTTPARTPRIAMTMRSSTSVKPDSSAARARNFSLVKMSAERVAT